MGTFMAELDTGRPQSSDRAYDTALNGKSDELELLAHYWSAKPQSETKIEMIHVETAIPWKSSGMMTFPPFDTPIGECLRGRACLKIEIMHESREDNLSGYVCLDDNGYQNGDSIIPPALICISMYAEVVEHIESGRRAFGYYLLVVKQSAHENKFERLGIGLAVSTVDLIPSGLLGSRKAPVSKIVLI
jgi:hypothetical protein